MLGLCFIDFFPSLNLSLKHNGLIIKPKKASKISISNISHLRKVQDSIVVYMEPSTVPKATQTRIRQLLKMKVRRV